MAYHKGCLAVFTDRYDCQLFSALGFLVLPYFCQLPVSQRAGILYAHGQAFIIFINEYFKKIVMEAFTFFGIFVLLIFVLILFFIYCLIFLLTDFIPKVRITFPEYTMMTKPDAQDPVKYITGIWKFAFYGFLFRKERESVLDRLFNIEDVRMLSRDELDAGIDKMHVLLIIFIILFLAILIWIPVLLVVLII